MAKKRIEYPINETFVIIAVGAILLLAAVFTFAAQVNPPQVIFRVSHEELFTDRIEPYADPGTIINADLSLEEISADAITLGGERRTTWPQADEGCSITSLTSSLAVGAQQSLLSFPTACSQGACSFRAVLTRNQGVVSFAQKNVWGTIHPFPVREGELQTTSKRVVSLYVMYGSANPVQLQKNSFIIDLPSQPGTNTVFSVAQTQGSCSLTYEESGEWRFTAIENANFFKQPVNSIFVRELYDLHRYSQRTRGVGKSTIGLRLAKQVAGKHLAIDEVLTSNKLDVIEGDCIPEKIFLRANVISLPFIKETVKENSPLIIDGNFYFAAPLDYFSRFGVPVYVFTLNASLTTCLARDAKRTKPIGARSIKAVYVLSKRISRGRLIDTEHKTVSAICEEILFYVRFEEEKRAKKPSSH